MPQNKTKITQRGLMVIIFVSLFSPVIRDLPKIVAGTAGPASWLSPIAALLPALALSWFMFEFLKNRNEGEGLADMIIRALGGVAGKAVLILYALWLIVCTSFILRSGGERMLSTVYENGSLPFYMVVMIAIALIAALGKVRALSRSAEMFFIILVIAMIVVFIFTLPVTKLENLLPVSYLDALPLLRAAVPVINIMSAGVYMTFLSGHVEKNTEKRGAVSRWAIFLALTITLILVTVIGGLGADITAKTQYPFFVMIRNVNIFNIAERVEAAVTVLWVVTDFIYLAALIMAFVEILGAVWSSGSRKCFAWIAAASALICAFFIAPDAFVLSTLSEKIVPAINLSLVFLGLPAIYIIGKMRKTI